MFRKSRTVLAFLVMCCALATHDVAAEEIPAEPEIVGWPTYMHDDSRSGATSEEILPPLHLQWTYHAQHAPQPAWPPPAKQNFWAKNYNLPARVTFDHAFHVVSDGERVYFGSSADDQVRALDLNTGRPLWTFFAEGPVRLAPTIAEGRAYFGSDDGRVYCLSGETGKQVWRFEAAPDVQRVIPGNSRMISTFPVRTGVVVHEGAARFGAGLFPNQGAFQFAVDAETGKLLARGELKFSPQGYVQRQGGALRIAQGRAPTTTLASVPNTTKQPEAAGDSAQYPFAWIRAGEIYFGGGDGEVAALKTKDAAPVWQAKVQGKAHSLAVAGGRLLVSTDEGWIYCFAPEKREASAIVRNEPLSKEFTWQDEAQQRELQQWSANIAQHVSVKAGYCLLLGGDARHAWALSKQTPLQIVAVQTSDASAARMRDRLSESGVYGRVVVRVADEGSLPFARDLFNLVVIAEGKDDWSPATVAQLVRPSGGVVIDSSDQQRLKEWRTQKTRFETIEPGDSSEDSIAFRRPPLADEGQWTHMYGDAANTSCSNDAHVKGGLELRWFGPPGPRDMVDRHHRATPSLYTAGRLFVPGNEQIFGVDAYNGAVLWQVGLPGFRRVGAPRDAGNMAAAPDTLYAVAKDRCYALDAADGSQRKVFAPPKMADDKPRDWGFVAVVEDSLYGSSTLPGASRSEHNREQIAETYYDYVPIVTSDGVFCLDRDSGQVTWRYASRAAILNPTLTIGGDRLYFVEGHEESKPQVNTQGRVKLNDMFRVGADLVALNRMTGKEVWRRPVDFSKVEHHLFLAYAHEKLAAVGTRNENKKLHYDLAVFDAKTGKPIWNVTQDQGQSAGGSHGEQDHHLAIVGDLILQEPYAYDLHTGKLRDAWRFARGGHGCGSISASASAFFFRAGNPTMCDLATGNHTKVNAVSRPGCWINMIPAGGLLLIPEASSGCTCNFAIQSSMAFAPREQD